MGDIMKNELVLIGGTANKEFNQKIAKELGVELAKVKIDQFADGEKYFRALESVRGKDVYIIQPTCTPANDNLMEILVTIDALKRASAGKITVVMPYMGYSRQERMGLPREPITARLVADLLEKAGANHMVLCDLHAAPIQGFFSIPVEVINPVPVFAEEFKKMEIRDVVVCSPDAGAMKKNKELAEGIGADFAVMMKQRKLQGHDTVADMIIIGDVKGKNVIMIDDIISTAGTLCRAAEILKKNGAKDIYTMATHAVLSGPAMENLKKTIIKSVLVGDTIPVPEEKKLPIIKTVSFAKAFAEVIRKLHNSESIHEGK